MKMSGTRSQQEEDNNDQEVVTKVFSKEKDSSKSSSRIYYYGGASVPFIWETQPGTPKHTLFSESFHLPPLTPPPSYYSSSSSIQKSQSKVKTPFIAALFNGKNHVSRSSFSWSSTSSSSSSSFSSSSPPSKTGKRRYLLCTRSPVTEEEEEEVRSSPTSILCNWRSGKRGLSSSMGSMKRVLCSVLSNGSSSGKDLRLMGLRS